MLKPNSSVSSAAASPVMVFCQVRKGVSRFQSLSKARYPCIMADTPMAQTLSRPFTPDRADFNPVHTSSRLYVQIPFS